MLVERVLTMLAPSGKYAALVVNLSSGLFTAFAGFFLCRCIFTVSGWLLKNSNASWKLLSRSTGAATGALAFGWCDSAWYSAVEAEVYAMSIFMTALCIWLMLKWSVCEDRPKSTRYLILISYLIGLSIGIHQLNLLCIPALVLIWGFKRGKGKWWKVLLLFIFSLFAVGVILLVIMPGMIWLASRVELFSVNEMHLPFLSGVVIFIGLLGGILVATLWLTHRLNARRTHVASWMATTLLIGYSAYALIPLRGDIPSPANSARPGDPFSFASYLSREQYGGAPLIYGKTPLSKPMLREEWIPGTTTPSYRRNKLLPSHPVWVRKKEGMTIGDKYHMLSHTDSLDALKKLEYPGETYIRQGYYPKLLYTPELNMWFPRITSNDPVDFPLFGDWAGMTKENMVKVKISEAVDTTGKYVNKLGADGIRHEKYSYRPTYWQSFRMFAAYQAGYMYFRYLLWNFSGRQNDVHSTGEVEHGNFITGFLAIDNAMLGAEQALPSNLAKKNKGRNRYYMLPLILGIFGIVWLMKKGKLGIKTDITVMTIFVMTGLAIVVYLNQSLGEARERDYSFLGSFWAFAAWIGFGAVGLLQLTKKFAPIAMLIPLFTVGWMFKENIDDHDRSNRTAASVIASNILESLPEDAILFVNGDNATFPLWYSQEVEGVRRDVRVINLTYLGVETYTEALMRDWEQSKRLPFTLSIPSITSGTLQFPHVKPDCSTTIPDALDMLAELEHDRNPEINYSNVYIKGIGRDSIPFSLRNLSKTGSLNLDIRRLLIFDLIATNAAQPTPRPILWLRTLPENAYAGFFGNTSEGIFTRELGSKTIDEKENDYNRILKKLNPPNPLSKPPYLDPTPAGQVSTHRAALLSAAKEMLSNGKISTAYNLALAADSLMGYDLGTYKSVHDGNSIFATRTEMIKLFSELADSLESSPVALKYNQRIEYLRKRTEDIKREHTEQTAEWREYKRTLPERLRFKTSVK